MPLVNFALKRIQSFPIEWNNDELVKVSTHDSFEQPVIDVFNLADALGRSQAANAGLSRGPFQRAVLYSTMKIRAAKHNQPVGSINHTSWMTPKPDMMPLLSLSRESWAEAMPQPTKVHNFDVPSFKVPGPDDWIELTLNNFDDKGHPFHLVSSFTPITPLPLTRRSMAMNSSSWLGNGLPVHTEATTLSITAARQRHGPLT